MTGSQETVPQIDIATSIKLYPLACYILSLSATTKHKNVAKRRLASRKTSLSFFPQHL